MAQPEPLRRELEERQQLATKAPPIELALPKLEQEIRASLSKKDYEKVITGLKQALARMPDMDDQTKAKFTNIAIEAETQITGQEKFSMELLSSATGKLRTADDYVRAAQLFDIAAQFKPSLSADYSYSAGMCYTLAASLQEKEAAKGDILKSAGGMFSQAARQSFRLRQ